MASALGDVTFGSTPNNVKRTVCLLAARTTTNSAPSAGTDGVPAYEDTTELYSANPAGAFFLGKAPGVSDCSVQVVSTAGSGTMTATVKIWGYLGGTGIGKWVLVKALNGGSAIPETGTDVIRYSEVVDGLGAFDRVAAELSGIAGSSTAIEVYLTTQRGA